MLPAAVSLYHRISGVYGVDAEASALSALTLKDRDVLLKQLATFGQALLDARYVKICVQFCVRFLLY